ncbi:MAG: hypothetical protein JO149_04175, partial [Gammaproteobacteria bacterium]|nr:hypothetical protein [Gammaproteobacteria bacterium]
PYPIGDKFALSILHDMHVSGAKISLVVHSVDHLTKLSDTMHDVMTPFPVIIEVDTSIRFWDGYIHLGARRSPIHTLDQLRQILKVSKTFKNIQVIGAMVYESAVAGLRDNDPYAGFMMNSIAWIVRKASAAHTAKICADIPTIFAEEGVKLNLFNGGGTGSISTTVGNKGLTEVTFGSGLLDPALFVNQYSNLNTLGLKPAIYFAIPVCTTDKGYVTCFQGGYVASGNISKAKQPIVISPAGLNNLDSEGWGEATTPFAAPENIKLTSGDPVICQPAKSGEISEFFNTLNCFRFFKHPANTPENQVKNKNKKEDQQAIERIVKTYRGYGHRF